MDMNGFLESIGTMAELQKAMYDANIRAGFTQEQSMELTKAFMGNLTAGSLFLMGEEDKYK